MDEDCDIWSLLIAPGSRCIWIRADPVLTQLRLLTVISDRLQCGTTPSMGLCVSKEAWELVMKTKMRLHFPGCHLTRKKLAKLIFRNQGDSETKAQER